MSGSACLSDRSSDMRVPLSWLSSHVELPPTSALELANRLTEAGLKVEHIDRTGEQISGVVIAVNPDRGYALSIRGVARELATAYGVDYDDPAAKVLPSYDAPGWDVVIDDPSGCDRYVARLVTGLDPTAQSPRWLRRRLALV